MIILSVSPNIRAQLNPRQKHKHDGRYMLTRGYVPDLSKEVGARVAAAANTLRKYTIY